MGGLKAKQHTSIWEISGSNICKHKSNWINEVWRKATSFPKKPCIPYCTMSASNTQNAVYRAIRQAMEG